VALDLKTQTRYWGIGAVVFFALMWLFGDVLLPFVLGGAIAYFLDPIADRLEHRGLSRMSAVVIISIGVTLLAILAVLLVVPLFISQSIALVSAAPQLIQDFTTFLTTRFPSLLDEQSALRSVLADLAALLQENGPAILQSAVASVSSLMNYAMIAVIAPIASIYLLYDWDNMISKVDALLPRDHAQTIRQLAGDIDQVISSFVRGMGTVCLIMGTYYAVALMIVGLQFGVVIGLIAGLVTFIPYVGALVGGALAIGLALFQFWGDWLSIGAVVAIFIAGQAAEGNVITPKLVGESVGLHPVWLLIALSVFGAMFGFVGMLIAVPVAASLGVLVRFAAGHYTQSKLYLGANYSHKDNGE
jgi:predicted PurR-regulated permease PerM